MLMYLIAVLVLLATGFYALSVGATGRIGIGEGPELAAPTRLAAIGIAVIAFGAAYLVYSRPERSPSAPTLAATPSNPPERRGSEPVKEADSGAMDEALAERDMLAKREATDAATTTTGETTTTTRETPVAAATTPATDGASTESSGDSGLSSAAAALEERASRRRAAVSTAPADFPVSTDRLADDRAMTTDTSTTTESTVATTRTSTTAMDAREPADTATPSRGTQSTDVVASTARATPSRRVTSTRSRRSHGALLLHVHNSLGQNQQREQLTLSIEGKPVADIDIDGSRPEAAVAVPLPRPGLLHYRLEGSSEDGGSTRLVGEGCIRVTDGARYVVRRRDGSRKVFLEAMSRRG